jgi:hypothetical protein
MHIQSGTKNFLFNAYITSHALQELFKKTNDKEPEEEATKTTQQTATSKETKLTQQQKEDFQQHRKVYFKNYYESKKEILIERAKINDKEKYHMRIVRELNQNKKDFDKMKPQTIEKYKIMFDKKKNEYIHY